jgi:preprotein translocase subunit SecE
MASPDDKDDKLNDAEGGDGEASSSEALATASESTAIEAEGEATELEAADGSAIDTDGEGEDVASSFGSERYVHAAFFAAGILAAFVASKTLVLIWNSLSGWSAAVRVVPQLVSFTEEQRDSYALIAGAIIGALTVIQAYRKESVRTWAGEVAAELTKVTWPTREAVLNGTLVVVVASALATVYVTILDRIWLFLTTLVYGA